MAHFTTITKAINNQFKGSIDYLKYLNNKEEHIDDEIINFVEFKTARYLKNLQKTEKEFIEYKKKQKQANKAKNYSQSWVLSLPTFDEKISKETFEKMIKDIIPTIKSIYKIDDDNFIYDNVYINVHHRKGKNSHINIVMNKMSDTGMVDLSKKRFLYLIRESFTKTAELHLGIKRPLSTKKQEIEDLKSIIRGQNKVIEKQLTQSELQKWTLIFLQNAAKYSKEQNLIKRDANLKKALNNIEKMESEEEKRLYTDMVKEIDMFYGIDMF